MAIWLTGDTHGHIDIGKLNTRNFPQQKEMTKDDFVIILGDFGCVWYGDQRDIYWLDWLEDKPFTTLFIPGNHENYDLLNKFPFNDQFGVEIRPSVRMLQRGGIYDINGKTFYCMGGASSHDKPYRIEGKSWWKQELPSQFEYRFSESRLNSRNRKVDYVLTHCAPDSIQRQIASWYEHDALTNYLECKVKQEVEFKAWYMGHYHINRTYYDEDNRPYHVLYDDIVKLED